MKNFSIKSSKFIPGQIITHKKYQYRGVIFDVDDQCLAEDEWYQSNTSPPKKEQPWYHVLVDEEDITTYVAEENLQLSLNADPIEHPLVQELFSDYAEGKYQLFFNS